jgi:hypothetical protein
VEQSGVQIHSIPCEDYLISGEQPNLVKFSGLLSNAFLNLGLGVSFNRIISSITLPLSSLSFIFLFLPKLLGSLPYSVITL